eukprot:scaffold492980_cov38-Prasinocladus_malaysianus.AAC.1
MPRNPRKAPLCLARVQDPMPDPSTAASCCHRSSEDTAQVFVGVVAFPQHSNLAHLHLRGKQVTDSTEARAR